MKALFYNGLKLNILNRKTIYIQIKKYSDKPFNFEEFAFKTNNASFNQNKANENVYKKKSRITFVINSKKINLEKIYKQDLQFLKIKEDFEINELRKKYLQFAKLYHPDTKLQDSYTSNKFSKLQQSYERLKIYHELRQELNNLESECKTKGELSPEAKKIFEEMNEENYMDGSLNNNISKDEFIKQLCKYIL